MLYRYNIIQYDTAQHSTAQHNTTQHKSIQYNALYNILTFYILKYHYDQIFTSWFFRVYHIEFYKRMKTPFYRLQIPALVQEIFKFEKCVKYANEMTDDVINSTQYYIKYINRAILANL